MTTPRATKIQTRPSPALVPVETADRMACSGLSDLLEGVDWSAVDRLPGDCALAVRPCVPPFPPAPVTPWAAAPWPAAPVAPEGRLRTALPTDPAPRRPAAVRRGTLLLSGWPPPPPPRVPVSPPAAGTVSQYWSMPDVPGGATQLAGAAWAGSAPTAALAVSATTAKAKRITDRDRI